MQVITEKSFEDPKEVPVQRIVKLTNFSDEHFTCTWNNKPFQLKPGEFKFMEAGIANVMAKHLINRELLKDGRENDTSPKKPQENPFYMALYAKAIEEMPDQSDNDDPDLARQEAIDRTVKASQTEKTNPAGEKVGKDEKGEFEEMPVDDDDDEEVTT